MQDNNQWEKLIIEKVINELVKNGLMEKEKNPSNSVVMQKKADVVPEDEGEAVTLPPVDEVLIQNPYKLDALKEMKQTTPARICIGRAGTRPRTVSMLRFLADHAVAQDAVFMDVSEAFLQDMNLFQVHSAARSKNEFLTNPDTGRRLSDEAIKIIKEKCVKDVQVQILVVDGLSSSAIEANVPDLLPPLLDGLQAKGIKVGTPFFIKNGRVWIQDPVAQLVNAAVVISLIGERPGLGTAESLSAYIIYRPNENTVEADRTVISNIHRKGVIPAEAGAYLVTVLEEILVAKASGVKLTLQKSG